VISLSGVRKHENNNISLFIAKKKGIAEKAGTRERDLSGSQLSITFILTTGG
jgi:hypothetical protein